MKIEEVIKQLESILDHTRSMAASPDADDIWRKDIDAPLEFALTALHPVSREQVVQAWRGEWKPFAESAYGKQYKCPNCHTRTSSCSNFCPHCGAPMTDEAVEMVMERLGALKDGKGD